MTKKKSGHTETFSEIESRGRKLEALIDLSNDMIDKEKRIPLTFNEFLHASSQFPDLVFRDIFQLFHDMVYYYVPDGVDEYGDHPDSIGFIHYDFNKLFIKNCDDPFFADRLFANRFMNLIKIFRQGIQNNQIYLFEGPPGSGKSTFLDNLLIKLEEYSKTQEGTMYKTLWRLDRKKLNGLKVNHALEESIETLTADDISAPSCAFRLSKYYLDIECPNNDHPILQIPKDYRKKFLNELIPDKKFKQRLFEDKEYSWVLKEIPCSICNSIYNALLDELGDPLDVFNMIYGIKVLFSRQFGKGISIFNPGDQIYSDPIISDEVQKNLAELLKKPDIKYIYSHFANTNNGVYALMDIKENNIERLMDLHGIISDGVHKVELTEERIKSMFVGLINPEDKKNYENEQSFRDRVNTISISYILDYNTECEIYKNKFGDNIEVKFLPKVLKNFAKIIISTRLNIKSPSLEKWIDDPEKYFKYLDDNLLLLKMDIYTGLIPEWLSEEDVKKFDRQTRKSVIAEAEFEGRKGISGRRALNIFNMFLQHYGNSDKLITMDNLKIFFTMTPELQNIGIPDGFINALEDLYDYEVLQEVKEAIYYFNEKQITREILNYLFAINFEPGTTEVSEYTGDTLRITEDYFKNFEALLLGSISSIKEREDFRQDVQSEYITRTLASEVNIEKKLINKTELFNNLFERYTRNLKEFALIPYEDNDNFRRALIDFGLPSFKAYPDKLKRDINFLMNNLKKNFDYTTEGAKQVCIYVFDKKLTKKFV